MTKRLMKDSLLELMEHQDLVKVSVTAICEISRIRSHFFQQLRSFLILSKKTKRLSGSFSAAHV